MEKLIKKRNQHDFCYQFSKDGPEFLFGDLRIGDIKYEPYLPAKNISCEYKIKTMFKKKTEEKEGS